MNRAGVSFIVLAAVLTAACGGAESVGSSPTGPSPTAPGSPSQPQPNGSAPSAPGNLTVASVTGTVVTLSWSAASGAAEYLILVGTSPSSSNTLSTNTTQTTYTWTVSPGTYYARVQAKIGTATSGSSNEVSFFIAG